MAAFSADPATAKPSRSAAYESTGVPRPPGFGYRWTIVALLFFATTINYIDRQVLGILAPTLQRELAWTESQRAPSPKER